MVRSTEPLNLQLTLPKPASITRNGGGYDLFPDHVEPFAWLSGVFTPVELDAIVNIGKSVELERATTFGGDNSKVRDSYVHFLFPNEITGWVFQRLAHAVNEINARYFRFDLFTMEQGLQFTRYTAPGEHYEWHVDRGGGAGTRKLSLSLQLSDPDDYEGGDLELWYGGEPVKAQRDRGMMTFFPAYTMHRVTPVTKGTRYSLVCWVSGPPFK